MPVIPGPVDSDGNITVPAVGGVVIPLKEQDGSATPVQLDISTLALRFVVPGRLDIVPTTDPSDVKGRLLTITDLQADNISTKGSTFHLLDVTNPLVPIPLWEGTIKRAS